MSDNGHTKLLRFTITIDVELPAGAGFRSSPAPASDSAPAGTCADGTRCGPPGPWSRDTSAPRHDVEDRQSPAALSAGSPAGGLLPPAGPGSPPADFPHTNGADRGRAILALQSLGVDHPDQLADVYQPNRILEVVAAASSQPERTKNPAAWCVAALRKNWKVGRKER